MYEKWDISRKTIKLADFGKDRVIWYGKQIGEVL